MSPTRTQTETATARKAKRRAIGWIALVLGVLLFLIASTVTSVVATRDANRARDVAENERSARIRDNAAAVRIGCERSNEQAEAFRAYLDQNTGTSITPDLIASVQDSELRGLLQALQSRSTQTADEARALRSNLVIYDCDKFPPIPMPDPVPPG